MSLPVPKPEISTCNACGKLFPRVLMRLCTSCAASDDNRYELVRDFLIENHGAALPTIAAETGVSHGDVRRFLDGGRLVEVPGSIDGPCNCAPGGPRCRSCRNDLASRLRNLGNEMAGEIEERGLDERSIAQRGTHVAPPTRSDGRTSYVRRIRRIQGDT